MTANDNATVLIPIGVLAFGMWLFASVRKTKTPSPPKTHLPNATGPGDNKADIARSKGAGLGPGSDNSGSG